MKFKTICSGKYDLHDDEHDLVIHRDEHGKFHVRIDGIVAHKRLTAIEMNNWWAGVFLKERVE